MAIDSATKRFSITQRGMPWGRPLPVPTGSFDRADRLHLLKLYGAPVVFFWRGGTDTAWSKAANWSLAPFGAGGAGVPDGTIECLVSDVYSSNDCYVDANAACARLRAIRIGGSSFVFNLLSADMEITNDFLVEGAVSINRGKGDLTIGRDFLQTGDASTFGFLTTLSGATPVMAVGRDLTVNVATGNFGPTKLAGHTITVGRSLSLNKSDGNLLGLLASGTWTLTVASGGGGTAVASNVNVSYSDASAGLEIVADGTCTDGENNLNWLFGGIVVFVMQF